jgi:hypothetical protein
VQTADKVDAEPLVEIVVEYLPAAGAFEKDYDDETALSTVRIEAMAFFQVKDHQDRDTHQFFLEFGGQRVTDTTKTLEQLFGRDRRHAKFNLVEQITPGLSDL